MRFSRILVIFGLCFACLPAVALASDSFDDQVREALRRRVETAGLPAELTVGRMRVYASAALPQFYLQRLFQPAWSRGGQPREEAFRLVAAIRDSAADGLVPGHYHLERIEALLASAVRKPSVGAAVDLDLLLTDAFLVLGSHFLSGRINPETIDPEWKANRREGDMVPTLRDALTDGDPAAALRALLPAGPGYAGLRAALAHYRQLAAEGAWAVIAGGATLRPGDRDNRIAALRERLARSGDLDAAPAAEDLFDENLEQAVRRFQTRHGLAPDGVVGPATLAALNVTAEQRVRQIELNLERWRWLPQELGRRHILVNIAAFHLDLVEEEKTVLEMRVVVGKPFRRTPVFSGTMTYLVLNPYWEVPPRIAARDLLPQIRKDPSYLQQLGMKVFLDRGAEARQVDPATVDWRNLTPGNFPYHLRQDPGPANALGRVKFMFPNPYRVYLHDTPSRELFLKETRTFSSGCIRLEKPLELAAHLLRGTPLASSAALASALAAKRAKTLSLPAPVPVHLLYWTAWVDGGGTLHFRPDIYGRDARLEQALALPPPAASRTPSSDVSLAVSSERNPSP